MRGPSEQRRGVELRATMQPETDSSGIPRTMNEAARNEATRPSFETATLIEADCEDERRFEATAQLAHTEMIPADSAP
jgi:hypothetical protein